MRQLCINSVPKDNGASEYSPAHNNAHNRRHIPVAVWVRCLASCATQWLCQSKALSNYPVIDRIWLHGGSAPAKVNDFGQRQRE